MSFLRIALIALPLAAAIAGAYLIWRRGNP